MGEIKSQGIGGFVGGSFCAGVVTYIVSYWYWGHPTLSLIIAALYLAMMAILPFWPYPKAPPLKSLSSREQFLAAFVPYFLAPLWIGCWMFVTGWMKDSPFIHYTGISTMFVLAVISFLWWFKLCDPPGK